MLLRIWALPCRLLALTLVLACAPAAPPRASAARLPTAPVAPLPADLEAVVRVDATALRAELGVELAHQLLRQAAALEGARAARLLETCLAASSMLWFGLRQGDGGHLAPVLLVLRGHYGGALAGGGAASSNAWLQAGELQMLELPAGAGSPELRIYRWPGDELLVWVSAPEAAGVERILQGGGERSALRAPERGALSVAARPEAVLGQSRARYPELTERFRGTTSIEAFAEEAAGSWRAELTLDFGSPLEAAGAGDVLERLKQALSERSCAVGAVARGLFVSRFARSLRVQAWLDGPELDAVRACVLGGGCCA